MFDPNPQLYCTVHTYLLSRSYPAVYQTIEKTISYIKAEAKMNRLFSSSATLRSQASKTVKMSLQNVTHCVFDMDGLLLGN